jgi:hypothetical protein
MKEKKKPKREKSVIALFSILAAPMGIIKIRASGNFPDIQAELSDELSNALGLKKEINIEVEYSDKSFREHVRARKDKDCDVVVCWEHNWPYIWLNPQSRELKIISLKNINEALKKKGFSITSEDSDEWWIESEKIHNHISDITKLLRESNFEIIRSAIITKDEWIEKMKNGSETIQEFLSKEEFKRWKDLFNELYNELIKKGIRFIEEVKNLSEIDNIIKNQKIILETNLTKGKDLTCWIYRSNKGVIEGNKSFKITFNKDYIRICDDRRNNKITSEDIKIKHQNEINSALSWIEEHLKKEEAILKPNSK